jgi:hypothetical protein
MGIKYLKGIYGDTKPKTTRPRGLEFPLGLTVSSSVSTANGVDTTTAETFDVLIVAGGGSGGPMTQPCCTRGGGGGGAGGIRIFSSNNFSELPEFKSPLFTSATTNFIPVIVGGGGGNSCFGASIINCRGGPGGDAQWSNPGLLQAGGAGAPGGSGGGRGDGGGGSPNAGGCGLGIDGQGFPGGSPVASPGGSALCAGPTRTGLSTAFTGTSVTYSVGGIGNSGTGSGAANRGDGGNGINATVPGIGPRSGGSGGSGIVAVRYRNPAAPTTPLATGGNCICCTGGCIIHIFDSSGFLNVTSNFSIN